MHELTCKLPIHGLHGTFQRKACIENLAARNVLMNMCGMAALMVHDDMLMILFCIQQFQLKQVEILFSIGN